MTDHRQVLVAGIGNIFLGDDGFGVEVAQRLLRTTVPAGVEVADFGVRGVHLAYELADGRYDAAILVDAAPRGGAPGTLYVIEPDPAPLAAEPADAHSLTPAAVLAWVRHIGGTRTRILLVGCEPASLDEAFCLSPPVLAAVDGAVALVQELAGEIVGPSRPGPVRGAARAEASGAGIPSAESAE